MKKYHLDAMTNGWFIGDFVPAALKTGDCEVAVKRYQSGDCEDRHFHKIAREITVVVQGTIEMCGQTFSDGDIIVLQPGEETAFRAVTDAVNVVVKIPGCRDDKYTSNR